MSNSIMIFEDESGLPTVKRESKLAKEHKIRGGPRLNSIKTNTNGTFKRMVGGEQIGKAARGSIDVIFVGHLDDISREYYKAAYDPDAKATLPDCWSNLGTKPEENVPNAQGKNCEGCKQNVAGSGNKGKGRACRYKRRVAVMVAGDKSGDIYQMGFAATSLFGEGSDNVHPFESYLNYLRANGEYTDTVVTRVSYDDEADTMKFKFSPVRHLTQSEVDLLEAAQEAEDVVAKYCTLTISEQPEAKKKDEDAEDEIEDEIEDGVEDEIEDEDEEEAAPVKRKSRRTKSDAPKRKKADLTEAMDDWLSDEGED